MIASRIKSTPFLCGVLVALATTAAAQERREDVRNDLRDDRRDIERNVENVGRASGPPQWIQPSPYLPEGAIQPVISREEDSRSQRASGGFDEGDRLTANFQVQTDAQPESTVNDGFGVAVGDLEQIDTGTVGTLTPETGGFPQDFWRDMDRSRIDALLPNLPVATHSPVRNQLLRRLLLSALPLPPHQIAVRVEDPFYQTPPEAQFGEDPADGPKPPVDLLVERLRLLAASGDLAAFLALYDEAPALELPEDARREVVDAFLLAGDLTHGCGLARQELRQAGSAFWLQRVAVCDAVDANENGVNFTLGLLDETGDAPPVFTDLVARVLERARSADLVPVIDAESVDPFSLPAANPLMIAMAEATEAPYTIEDYTAASPLALLKLARDSRVDAPSRAVVAVMGSARGVVSVSALGAILIATDLEPAEEGEDAVPQFESIEARFQSLSKAVIGRPAGEQEVAGKSASEHALDLAKAYKNAAFEPDEELRVTAIRDAWDVAGAADARLTLAAALSDLAKVIPPEDGRQGFAHDAARLHLLSGRQEDAVAWYADVRGRAGLGDAKAADALVKLWPLMVVGVGEEGGVPFSEAILGLWRQQLAELPFDEQNRRSELLYGLLEALGHTVPYDAWEQLLAGNAIATGYGPSLAYVRQLEEASESGRMGEVVLLTLTGLGRAGPDALEPSGLAAIVAALHTVGLEEEARALALETMVSAGF